MDAPAPKGAEATRLLRRRDKPVVITENGYVGDDDRERIRYIALHLAAVRHAIDLGVDVRGYLYWSTMDNWEWGSFAPRFGLVQVDFQTFRRTPKPSSQSYRDVIHQRGIDAELLSRHTTPQEARDQGPKQL